MIACRGRICGVLFAGLGSGRRGGRGLFKLVGVSSWCCVGLGVKGDGDGDVGILEWGFFAADAAAGSDVNLSIPAL